MLGLLQRQQKRVESHKKSHSQHNTASVPNQKKQHPQAAKNSKPYQPKTEESMESANYWNSGRGIEIRIPESDMYDTAEASDSGSDSDTNNGASNGCYAEAADANGYHGDGYVQYQNGGYESCECPTNSASNHNNHSNVEEKSVNGREDGEDVQYDYGCYSTSDGWHSSHGNNTNNSNSCTSESATEKMDCCEESEFTTNKIYVGKSHREDENEECEEEEDEEEEEEDDEEEEEEEEENYQEQDDVPVKEGDQTYQQGDQNQDYNQDDDDNDEGGWVSEEDGSVRIITNTAQKTSTKSKYENLTSSEFPPTKRRRRSGVGLVQPQNKQHFYRSSYKQQSRGHMSTVDNYNQPDLAGFDMGDDDVYEEVQISGRFLTYKKSYVFPIVLPTDIDDIIDLWETDFQVGKNMVTRMGLWEKKGFAPKKEDSAKHHQKYLLYKGLYAKWVQCNKDKEQWYMKYWNKSLINIVTSKSSDKNSSIPQHSNTSHTYAGNYTTCSTNYTHMSNYMNYTKAKQSALCHSSDNEEDAVNIGSFWEDDGETMDHGDAMDEQVVPEKTQHQFQKTVLKRTKNSMGTGYIR